jgi:hypothetical protein
MIDYNKEVFVLISVYIELNQKEFDFKYTDGTSDSPPLHSHQKDRTLKVPGQERITIVEDITISRDNIHQTTRSAKPCYPWIEAIKHSRVFIWIQAQCVSAENRYAFQMSVAFTLAALFVIVEPISNIFPNAFWVGKIFSTSKKGGHFSNKLQ